MSLKRLLVPLAFSMLFSSGVAVAAEAYSEPYKCYGYGQGLKSVNLSPTGLIKLCSGTTDYLKTINCFERSKKEYRLSESGAIKLCKSNSAPF
tara:strand:- start:3323 stop:3601 length:279 start_codon:yes stop_codon:yes gene_type:complete